VTNVATPDTTVEFEPFRAELTGYCYRMLGSTFDADDAVQATMVRAWRGYHRFEGRSSLRSWLYRIATNVCFDLLHGRARRAVPMDLGPSSPGDSRLGDPSPEVPWIEPLPGGADPADVAVGRETIRLAFVAALQFLPARQRAILILRDVLGWSATEVAALLDITGPSVHSALQRARTTLAARNLSAGMPLDPVDEDQLALLARYVDAFERFDVDALVSIVREDAVVSMPPWDLWLQGREQINRWWNGEGAGCQASRFVPTWANGAPAFGLYKPSADGGYDAFAIQVVEVSGRRISALHSFLEPRLFRQFGLPVRLAQ